MIGPILWSLLLIAAFAAGFVNYRIRGGWFGWLKKWLSWLPEFPRWVWGFGFGSLVFLLNLYHPYESTAVIQLRHLGLYLHPAIINGLGAIITQWAAVKFIGHSRFQTVGSLPDNEDCKTQIRRIQTSWPAAFMPLYEKTDPTWKKKLIDIVGLGVIGVSRYLVSLIFMPIQFLVIGALHGLAYFAAEFLPFETINKWLNIKLPDYETKEPDGLIDDVAELREGIWGGVQFALMCSIWISM